MGRYHISRVTNETEYMQQSYSFDWKRFLIDLVLIFFLLSMTVCTVMVVMEYKQISIKSSEYKKGETKLLEMETSYISDEFGVISNALTFLAKTIEENQVDKNQYKISAKEWIRFLDAVDIYDSASFIDSKGIRKFSVQYDSTRSYIVENKSMDGEEKLCFEEGLKLKNGQIFIGNLGLKNIDVIYVLPLEPLITLSTQVYINGNLEGVVLIRYYANYTIKRFEDIGKWRAGELSLITYDGYFIFDSFNNDWGLQHNSAKEYKDIFTNAWQKIVSNESQFSTNEGVFKVLSLDLPKYLKRNMSESVDYEKYIMEDENWKIISRIDVGSEIGYYTSPKFWNILTYVLKSSLIYQFLIFVMSLVVTFLNDMNIRSKLKIKFFATHDGMTYLWNRRAGIELLEKKLPDQNKRKTNISICYIDVNGLKIVNNNLGHKYGDELILTVADCLKNTIRDTDMAVRMGGDEFLLILNDVGKIETEIVCKYVQEKIDKLNDINDRPYLISLSYGIIGNDEFGTCSAEDLIIEGDRRMYEHKIQSNQGLNVLRNDFNRDNI